MLCDVALGNPYIFEESLNNSRLYPKEQLWQNNSIIRKGVYTLENQTGIIIDGVMGFCGNIQSRNQSTNLTGKKSLPNFTNDYLMFDPKRINVKAIVKLPMKCANKDHLCRCWYEPPIGFQRDL